MPAPADRPPPEFQLGQLVRVVPNDRDSTPRTGPVRSVVWHYKDQRYNYYLEEDGRSVSKRYLAEDLRPVADAP